MLSVGQDWDASAQELVDALLETGIRATLHSRETLGYRIREAELHKIPYMAVVGEREASEDTVAVRERGKGKKQDIMSRVDFISLVGKKVTTRALA